MSEANPSISFETLHDDLTTGFGEMRAGFKSLRTGNATALNR